MAVLPNSSLPFNPYVPLWMELLGYDGLFVVDSIGKKKGGLILLWKKPLVLTVASYSDGHIDSVVQDGEHRWRFTGFYGNPDTSKRKYSWELMRKLAAMGEFEHLPWLIGGDFNEICSHNEKSGGRRRPETQIDEFNRVIEECELREIYGEGDWFTSVNRRSGEEIIFEKLDRFLSTFNWRLLYPIAKKYTLEYYSSDHRAVGINWRSRVTMHLTNSEPRGRKFKFEKFWSIES
ncbi:hypothetical protein DH2020_013597 [Rehmannia glutinosa]|uniref:Endonuclease/exonuclease/phosphatase domain-containing protein n=1 Tax=Rehmannia glutinosa TaxID=99300 RepID=A0ABR0X2Q9_REHGL